MKLTMLKTVEGVGDLGQMATIAAKHAYKHIKDGNAVPYIPGHKPSPGKAAGMLYSAKLVLTSDVEGLGRAGETVSVNGFEANCLIAEKLGLPERLAGSFLRDLHAGKTQQPAPDAPLSREQLRDIELLAMATAHHDTDRLAGLTKEGVTA